MIRQAFKDLGRLNEIARVAARHGFGELVNNSKIADALGRRTPADLEKRPPEGTIPLRFRLLLTDLGPTFVKLGQTLSARPDLLPRAYVQELAHLQDNVPPEPIEHVLEQIRTSLGRDPKELYAEIDERPLASASIAQVHCARLHSGEEVVIKVQRPGIAAQVRADLDLLHYAAKLLEAVVEETGIYTPTGIVEEFDAAIHEELDFLNEAKNLREFQAANLSRDEIVIPRVYDELTSKTVLTMERLHGERIRSIDKAAHDPVKLANRIIACSFRQIFSNGMFHADPHPGNILVLEGDRIGLLDFGAVGKLTQQMRETLIRLVIAVSLKDAETVARLLYRIATPDQRTNLAAFSADIRGALERYMAQGTTLGSVDAKQLIPEMLNLAIKYHVKIPKEYALLSRAGLSVEGLLLWLHPNVDITEAVMPYAKELLLGRLEPGDLNMGAMRTLLRLQTLTTDLPMQLSQVLLDLEGGKFHVNIGSEELTRLDRSIKSLAFVIFFGLIASGLTIGAFLSFARLDRLVFGIPLLGMLALLALGGLFLLALGWSFAGAHLKRIRLSRWFRPRK